MVKISLLNSLRTLIPPPPFSIVSLLASQVWLHISSGRRRSLWARSCWNMASRSRSCCLSSLQNQRRYSKQMRQLQQVEMQFSHFWIRCHSAAVPWITNAATNEADNVCLLLSHLSLLFINGPAVWNRNSAGSGVACIHGCHHLQQDTSIQGAHGSYLS